MDRYTEATCHWIINEGIPSVDHIVVDTNRLVLNGVHYLTIHTEQLDYKR